jgi:hypothetical protein
MSAPLKEIPDALIESLAMRHAVDNGPCPYYRHYRLPLEISFEEGGRAYAVPRNIRAGSTYYATLGVLTPAGAAALRGEFE